MKEELVLTKIEGGVATVTLNSPKNLNALNDQLIEALSTTLDQLQLNPDIRVLLITGNGRAFIAGADIAAMSTMGPEEAIRFGEKGASLAFKIENFPTPVIGVINGFALGGGCEIALACDIRVASDKAKMGLPEVGLGIIPGFSGTVRLQRVVGAPRAKELIYTGKMINAEEALTIGLVNRVVPHEELMDSAVELAKEITNNSPSAVRMAKKAINLVGTCPIEKGIEIENTLFALTFASEDQKEGMSAFLEKRTPSYKL